MHWGYRLLLAAFALFASYWVGHNDGEIKGQRLEAKRLEVFKAKLTDEANTAREEATAARIEGEKINAETRLAFGVAMEKLRALERGRAADRVRRAADGACAGGGGVPAAADTSEGDEDPAGDPGSGAGATEAATPSREELALRLLYFEHWACRHGLCD